MLKSSLPIRLLIIPLLAVSIGFVGCSDDDDNGTGPAPDNGFEAGAGDFQVNSTWERIDYTVYPTASQALGGAHEANDPNVARMVYKNPDAGMDSTGHTRGTVVVKETFSWVNGQKQPATSGAFLGMAKRAGEFNMDNGGWEYFDLGADGNAIAGRGADLMQGMCQGCHTAAMGYGGMDYIFDHPAEYVVADADIWTVFDDPTQWEFIEQKIGDDPFLGPAHGGGDLYRDIYRWQPAAMYSDGQFPIGTIILKEVYEMDSLSVKTNITWTGMIKRGGDFDPTHGNWEYIMMDPVNQTVIDKGALSGCISCHSGANSDSPASGGDYIFSHPGLGF